jgi:hypothetical protein
MLDFVESAWYASAVFVSLYSFWGAVLISKNYILATGIEERRVDEASHLLRIYCSTTEGAALAYEFAKCEDARLLLSNDKINKLRILERTLLTFFDSDFNMSVAQIFNLLIVYMAVFFFFFTNKKLGGMRLEREEYSLLAQHKLHTTLLLDAKKMV